MFISTRRFEVGGQLMSTTTELYLTLDGAVARAMEEGPVALMFSGGLDSGLLAALAREHGTPHLYTVGIEGSHDLRMSEEMATVLDLPWTPLHMTAEDVLTACRDTEGIVRIDHPVVLSFELPLQMIASRVPEGVLMSGQGADEMFGGYNRYLEMPGDQLERAMRDDLAKVLSDGAPLDQVIAGHYGKRVAHPFLDPEVRSIAETIPARDKVRDGVRKAPLRDVATAMGMELIAAREKKAAQYGSGFMKVMKSQARKQKLELKELIAKMQAEQEI
jgi:asparagine synthase (glutamine-hydrolysing)